jgi:LPXTG-site transpeptidase (sortase) family protein
MIDQLSNTFDARLSVQATSSELGRKSAWIAETAVEDATKGRAFLFLKGRLWLVLIVIAGFLFSGRGVALADGPAEAEQYAIPVRLHIPAIDLDSDIVTVGSKIVVINGRKYRQWDTSNTVVGWQQGSATLGQPGNTVLTGHSDIYTQIFRDLNQLHVGDEIVVSAENEIYRYRVARVMEVRESGVSMAQRVENGKWIATTDDERLTLITCSRPGASHRLIVVAYPVPRVETLSPAWTYLANDLRLKQLK